LPPQERLLDVIATGHIVDRIRIAWLAAQCTIARPPAIQMRMDDVDGDAVKPTAKSTIAAKAADRAIRPDENVLNEILGVAIACRERAHEVVDAPAVPANELVERLPAACRGLGHQNPIRIQSAAHGISGRQVAPVL